MPRLAARLLPCLLLALAAAAAPAAAAGPGQVELSGGWLRYDAAPGQANDVVVALAADEIVLSDAGAELRAAAGCHPGSTAHQVVCTPADAGDGFSLGMFAIATGDGDDRVRVEVDGTDEFAGFTAFGTLDGGPGADVLEGGDGADTLIGGPGADVLRGGAGESDTVSYEGRSGPVTVVLGAPGTPQGGADDGAGDTVAADVENAIGGAGDDTLTGDDRANQLLGDDGHDVLRGGGDADWLSGGTGWGSGPDDDTLDGQAGDDRLAGGRGADAFSGGGGEDTVDYLDHWTVLGDAGEAVTVTVGAGGADDGASGEHDLVGADVENVSGGPGDDTITGDAGPNRLDGGGGADTIDGGGGADVLTGGSDDEADVLDGGADDDVLRAGVCCAGPSGPGVGLDGADTLRGGDGEDRADYSLRAAPVHVTLDAVADDGASGEHDLVAADVEDVTGGAAGDVLVGDGDANRLHGGPGTGADVLQGGDGADRLTGGHGQWSGVQGVGDGLDELDGGPGDDRIDARDRAIDTVACGDGADDARFDEPDPEFDPARPEDQLAGDCEDRNAPRDETAAGTGSATTDDGDGAAEPSDPVETTVTSAAPDVPLAIQERSYAIGQLEGDWRTVGQWIQLVREGTGPPPELTITVTVDASLGDDVTLLGAGAPLAACDADTPYWEACLAADTVTLPDGDRRFTVFSHDPTSLHVAVPLAGRVFLDQSGGGRLVYRARPGKPNDVALRFTAGTIALSDQGGAPRASTGCVQVDAATVRCDREETGWSVGGFAVSTGDGDDRVTVVTGTPEGGIPSGTLDGGPGDDELTGGAGADYLLGGAGADRLRGGGGYDTAVYGDHAEPVTASIGGGADDGNATDGPAAARDDVGTDVEALSGTAQDDVLNGDGQANQLAGGPGADTLAGGGGADRIDGGGSLGPVWVPGADGADALDGGAGADTLDGGPGPDDIAGGDGRDTVDYADRYERPGVVVTLGDAGAGDGSADDGPAGARDTVRADVERVTGTPAADVLTGDAGPNRIDGGGGPDTIDGGGGGDVLSGGADTAGDLLKGGAGADTFLPGTVWMDGQVLPDGPDRIRGGDGIDRVDYASRDGGVNVTLDGVQNDGASGEFDDVAADVESVSGGAGDDTLTGGAGDDRLHGGPGGSDTLNGGDGDDRLIAGWSENGDTLRGGAGMDTLSAANGVVDLLDCGADLDVAYVDDHSDLKDIHGNCELRNPEGATRTVEPGGTLVLDGGGATPVALAVTSPQGGEVSAAQSTILQEAPQGVGFLGLQLNITAPDASLDDPLRITFTVDKALVPAGGAAAVRVFRDGAEVDATCPEPGRATAAGCIAARTTLDGGDVELVVLTAHASAWNLGAATTPPPADPPVPPAPGPPASSPGPAADTTAPVLGVKLGARQRLGALRAGKLAVPVRCSEACRYTVELRLDRKAAKRLDVPALLARAGGRISAAGRGTVQLRAGAKAARRLPRVERVRATLTVVATDAAGNRARVARRLTLR